MSNKTLFIAMIILVFGIVIYFLLFTRSGADSPAATPAGLLGADRDAHGCIGSAGYSWCQAKEKCLRIWEEPCE